jgi:hypothetical protein
MKHPQGCSSDVSLGLKIHNGEFDPGSERTLAAWIRHASRTRKNPSGFEYSGERVSNAWETCLRAGDNVPNGALIPHNTETGHPDSVKDGLYM